MHNGCIWIIYRCYISELLYYYLCTEYVADLNNSQTTEDIDVYVQPGGKTLNKIEIKPYTS